MRTIKPFTEKVRLFKVIDGKEEHTSSGFITPNPPEPGECCWVGSISSRDGWQTTTVQSVKRIRGGVEFDTLNSTYRVRPLPG